VDSDPQRFAGYARRAVEDWPELTTEQTNQLAVLLRPEPDQAPGQLM
jgi:hypothetical protein